MRVIVSGIVNNNGKVLLGRKHKDRKPYANCWHLLGGGVRDFERAKELIDNKDWDNDYFHDELKRELTEEGNIVVNNIRSIIPKYQDKPAEDTTFNKFGEETHYIFLVYLCDYVSGNVKASDDIAEVRWIKKDKLKSLRLTPPSVVLFNELGWM